MTIVIEIAGKAVAKGRGRAAVINGHAHVFTPAHTRSYENRLKGEAGRAMGDMPPMDKPVSVSVDVYLDIPKSFSRKKKEAAACGALRPTTKPDVDNYVKAALDGINQIVIKDDSQVVQLQSSKWYSEKPRLRIEVSELTPALESLL